MIAVLVIGGAFYLLENHTGTTQEEAAKKPAAGKRKMPPRVAEKAMVMENHSSAALPPREAVTLKKPQKVRQGTVAIIVDDMGNSTHEADSLLALDVPITFSLIPGFAKVREVAEAAHRKGEEVMVHMPMEPKGYQQKPFEKNGLLLAMSDDEVEKRVKGYLRAVPYAVGANNHMGSRFTEDRSKMQIVLTVLKGKGMFFIDSKTTPASVGDKVAREMGIPVASRNVFLDNEQDVGAIKAQLAKLAGMAKKSGSAIGICHPHKATLQALAAELPLLKGEGITFVHVSTLVR
ncbi:MAG TPA: divergent polysaccharide deacetylase family protein [Geobacteraceae bacterium]